jgi:hypothetical protein
MTATDIQTIAAVIQAAAAIVFLLSVLYDAYRRNRLGEQERRDALIRGFQIEFLSAHGNTPSEAGDLLAPRQTEFFNTRLKEMGEQWTYPFRRVGWW